MRLTTQDCLAIGFCIKGQMRFCRRHSIDFKTFLKEGIEAEAFAGIEDDNLMMALAQAAARKEGLNNEQG